MNYEQVWDSEFAAQLIGATVLVGLTYERADGPEQVQFWGVVTVADPSEGVCLELEGARAGEVYWLPPQTDVFQAARPGIYVLRATDESVEDPDYTAMWTITPPAN